MCVCNIYKYMCVSVRLFVCAAALLAQTGPLALIEAQMLFYTFFGMNLGLD